jgi:hypothetical protein
VSIFVHIKCVQVKPNRFVWLKSVCCSGLVEGREEQILPREVECSDYSMAAGRGRRGSGKECNAFLVSLLGKVGLGGDTIGLYH